MKQTVIHYLLCAVVILATGCTGNGSTDQNSGADSIYAWKNIRRYIMEQPERALEMVDTAEMRGLVDVNNANWFRSVIYYNTMGNDMDKARYYSLLVLNNKNPEADSLLKQNVISQLVALYTNGPETYQEAVKYAIRGANIAHQLGDILKEATFYFDAGKVMERLQPGSGIAYMYRCLDVYRKASQDSIQPLPVHSTNLGATARILAEQAKYSEAIALLEERLQVVNRIDMEYTTAPAGWSDQQRAYTYTVMAYCQQMLGEKDAARRTAEAYEQLKVSQNPHNLYDILNYYAIAGNAARIQQIYDFLEPIIREDADTLSGSYAGLLQMYSLGLGNIGRYHEAYDVLSRFQVINDTLVQRERQSETLKFAQEMKTQEKDAEIAQQQAELNRQRIIGLLIAIVLLSVFFVVYTLFRRRAAKRLADMKAAQERIESELQIARDIQMSMVPHEFPNYEGLDMYASMTPAKEVGGDLYGYVIRGQQLYFALGDVSGKGVPASLFMAQATRLFRTLANQDMLPAEICTRMNYELSGADNVNGMFVTMWIGMLNMESGHLKYCNAGHNPPIIGGGDNHGDFLEMIPNAPIGLWPELEYEGEEMDSVKGRALFIYTDGLNEAEDPEQNQFGDDRLLDILRNTQFDTAQQVIENLAAQVEEHRRGAEPNDDLTMLCLRVN